MLETVELDHLCVPREKTRRYLVYDYEYAPPLLLRGFRTMEAAITFLEEEEAKAQIEEQEEEERLRAKSTRRRRAVPT